MPAPTIKMAPADWLWIALLSVIWGGSFIFIKVALGAFPPLTLVTLRLGIAAALLIAWLAATGRLPRFTRAQVIALATMGLLNNAVPFSLISWGQTELDAGLASIFNATAPLFSIVVAHLWTSDDKITPSRIVALLVGFTGVIVLMGGESLTWIGGNLWAECAVLAAAVFYAVSGVYGRRLARLGVAPMAAATGQFTVSFVILAPLALAIDRPWTLAPPSALASASLIALAILNTALAYLIYFKVLARSGATNVLLVTLLAPISAILLGAVLLGERVSAPQLAGMALIFAGLAVADGRLAAQFHRATLRP